MRARGPVVRSLMSRLGAGVTPPRATTSRALRTPGMLALCAFTVLSGPAGADAAARHGVRSGAPQRRSGRAQADEVARGGWTWFTDPRASYVSGAHRRVYTGAVDPAGDIVVTSHDEVTLASRRVVVKRGWSVDDHNNPSLLALADKRLMVFYCRHDRGPLFYRLARRPESLSFGAERRLAVPGRLGCTYPKPVLAREERARVYLFFRGGDWLPAFRTSDDGRHWSPPTTLIDPGTPRRERPYLKVAADASGTIHLAFTEDSPFTDATSIYYAAFRAGRVTAADGSPVASLDSLPFAPTAAMRVYDGRTSGARAWVHDVAVDALGRPVVVYATFPALDDHRYHYAVWTGSGWFDHEIVAAGGSIDDGVDPLYSGGIALDHANPAIVYLSRRMGAVHEIERWITPNGGASWSARALTTGSTQANIRPVVPVGAPAGKTVEWMRGTYTSFTNFATDIVIAHPRLGRSAGPAA